MATEENPSTRTWPDRIRRHGSAHEEHIYGDRAWCAICGWIDAIAKPTEIHKLYHGDWLAITHRKPGRMPEDR